MTAGGARSQGAAAGAGGVAGEPTEAGFRAVVNGVDRRLPPGATVADVVAAMAESLRGVAVAVDREVVPRSSWATTELHEGDQVEVVTAAAGG